LLLGSVSITKQLGTAFYIIVFFIFGMLTILLAAIYEEIICRGYILRTLENHFDQRTAIFLSSLFFSVAHLLNPNSSVLGSINLFLSAIILAIVTIHFNNLWLPIGLHYGWNLWLVIFNFPVSGRTFPNPIIKLSYNEYNIIVGNKFGPEDSILLTVIMVILIGYFLFKHGSKDRVIHTNNI